MIAIKGMDMPANCGECPLTYQLPNGLRGKTSYKGLMSWDMTGYGDYVLTVSMRNALACLALQGTYPTTITAVSKEEYEK